MILGGVRGHSTSAGPCSHCAGEGGGGGGTTGGTRICTTKRAGLGASMGASLLSASSGKGATGAGATCNGSEGRLAGMWEMGGVVGGGDGSIDTSIPDSPGLWKGKTDSRNTALSEMISLRNCGHQNLHPL